MSEHQPIRVLTDAQWAELAPLIEACRPPHKTAHKDLRRTIEAILWRHQNGAKWRAIPPELGPWWMAAQTFIRWSRHGVWERLLVLVQQQGDVQRSLAFLDGSTIRAHAKAAGAPKRGTRRQHATGARRSGARAGVMAPRRV
jgi:transposase